MPPEPRSGANSSVLAPQSVAARACPAREVWGWSPQHGGVPRFPALCSCSHPALSTLRCWARSIPKETQDQPPLCLPALLPPGQGEARFGTVPPRDPAGQGPGPGGFSCTHHLPAVTDRHGAHSLSLVPGPWPTPSLLSEKKPFQIQATHLPPEILLLPCLCSGAGRQGSRTCSLGCSRVGGNSFWLSRKGESQQKGRPMGFGCV